MKSLHTLLLGSVALAAFAFLGSTQARADYYAPGHPYTYGHDGYWDEHHGYHHWDHYNGHDGYWHRENGVRIFVDI
jgi:hypothetical protein